MTLHYELKPPTERYTPTVIELGKNCEASYGYQSRLKIPEPPQPYRLIHGTLVHGVSERIWRGDFKELSTSMNFAQSYFQNVFDGVYGPKGDGTGPVSIVWFSPHEAMKRTKEELEQLVKRRKSELIGNGTLGVEAIWNDYAWRRPGLKDAWVEENLRKFNPVVRSSSGRLFTLGGKMDRVEFNEDGSYDIYDTKTGKTVLYVRRETLIDSFQPTVYSEGMRQAMHGQSPRSVFLQPLPSSREELNRLGNETLLNLRIEVEPRTETHVQELADFIDDVTSIVDMVENPENHAYEARQTWQPISNWGKKSDLTQNVRQGRLVPRIGPWCHTCKYLVLCREDNAADWAAEREKRFTGTTSEIPPQPFIRVKKIEAQNEVPGFEQSRRRPVRIRKRDAERKKELTSSGEYYPQHRFLARIKNVLNHVLATGTGTVCPCRTLKLIPLRVLDNYKEILAVDVQKPKKSRTRADNRAYHDALRRLAQRVKATCTYPDCPHRTPPSDEA